MGLLGTEAFPWPPFPICKQQTPVSTIFLEVQRAGSNRCSSGKRKDAETREKRPRNNSADLGVGLVSPQEIHISEFFYSTKTPNKRKMLTFVIPEKV